MQELDKILDYYGCNSEDVKEFGVWVICFQMKLEVVNIEKFDSNVSFFCVVRVGNLDKVVEYLKGGIDINICNQNGFNVFYLVVKEGYVGLVQELLGRGFFVDFVIKKGNIVFYIVFLVG